MSGVRNSSVARGTAADGSGNHVYEVPPGHVLILKSAYFRPNASTTWSIRMYVGVPSSAGLVTVAVFPNVSAEAEHWDGWLVLNAGDFIQLNPSGASVDYWVSGAVLPSTL